MNEGKDCVDRWNEDEDCTCSVVPVAMTNGEMRRLVQFAKVCRLSAGELVRAFVADLLMLEDSKDEAAKRKAREWFVHRTTPIVNY